MKKLFFTAVVLLFLSCTTSNNNNECAPFIYVSETLNLSLPQYIDLQVPGGWAYAPGGHRGLIIYRANVNSYLAYDRMCPDHTFASCSTLIMNPSLKMVCPCDDAEFSPVLAGQPYDENATCPAIRYHVEIIHDDVIRVSNF